MKDYSKIKSVFKEGDWVVGTGKHVGCSQVFDWDTDNPQPFSYLDEDDPDQFRLATKQEISDQFKPKGKQP